MKKNKMFRLGVFLIIIVGIISYYEYRIKDYKKAFNTTCYQLKKGVLLTKGQELKANMFREVKIDGDLLPEDYVKTLVDVENWVALENFYDLEILRAKKVVEEKNWNKDYERFVWLPTSTEYQNIVAGNDLRPGDEIDIFIYDPLAAAYILYDEFENLTIFDLKDKDFIKYSENENGSFVITNICLKLDNIKYNKLIDKVKISNNDFKVSIHGNRPKVDKIIKQNSSVIDSLNY